MSTGALFAIGAVVFIFGALGLVLFGLDTFQAWGRRETGEDEHLRRDGSVGEVLGVASGTDDPDAA